MPTLLRDGSRGGHGGEETGRHHHVAARLAECTGRRSDCSRTERPSPARRAWASEIVARFGSISATQPRTARECRQQRHAIRGEERGELLIRRRTYTRTRAERAQRDGKRQQRLNIATRSTKVVNSTRILRGSRGKGRADAGARTRAYGKPRTRYIS